MTWNEQARLSHPEGGLYGNSPQPFGPPQIEHLSLVQSAVRHPDRVALGGLAHHVPLEVLAAIETGVLEETVPEVTREETGAVQTEDETPPFHETAEANLARSALRDDYGGWGPARTRREHPRFDSDGLTRLSRAT